MNVDEIHLYSSRISGIFGKNIQSLQMIRIDICRDQKTDRSFQIRKIPNFYLQI